MSNPRRLVVQEAYQFSVAYLGPMTHIPCYCGCGAIGHTSNYACYVSGSRTGRGSRLRSCMRPAVRSASISPATRCACSMQAAPSRRSGPKSTGRTPPSARPTCHKPTMTSATRALDNVHGHAAESGYFLPGRADLRFPRGRRR